MAILQIATHIYTMHGLSRDDTWEEHKASALSALDLSEYEFQDLLETL